MDIGRCAAGLRRLESHRGVAARAQGRGRVRDHPRHAGPATVCIYVLVFCGAMLRVFGPATDLPTTLVLAAAAVGWSGAYLLFALVYGPYLLRPSIEE